MIPTKATARARHVLVGVAVVLLAACGGGTDDAGPATTPTSSSPTSAAATSEPPSPTPTPDATTASATAAPPTSETATGPTPTEAASDAPVEDLLTLASGVHLASIDAGEGAADSASKALRVVDGAPEGIGIARDDDPPTSYLFVLPAPTTFTSFVVPDVGDRPGNTTFFERLEVAVGDSADALTVVVDTTFTEPPEDDRTVTLEPTAAVAGQLVRITLSGALEVEPDDVGRTVVQFTELVGVGTQEPVPLLTAFDGLWDLRFTDAPDQVGPLVRLRQEGATVSGCLDDTVDLRGTVAGSVARVAGVDRESGRESVYVLTVDGDGRLQGVESTNGGVFRSRFGPVAEGTTPCDDVVVAPPACGDTVYVNFEVASAEVRPDSAAVLDDLASGLADGDGAVTIEGHTSTEGSDASNQDLSERRAAAVVAALAERGVDAGRLTAVGFGETRPLVDERDEASRAINRRVEVVCPG